MSAIFYVKASTAEEFRQEIVEFIKKAAEEQRAEQKRALTINAAAVCNGSAVALETLEKFIRELKIEPKG